MSNEHRVDQLDSWAVYLVSWSCSSKTCYTKSLFDEIMFRPDRLDYIKMYYKGTKYCNFGCLHVFNVINFGAYTRYVKVVLNKHG